ncbi:hypothetical protein THAOC_34194, partial [Thalassiosira oceanica]
AGAVEAASVLLRDRGVRVQKHPASVTCATYEGWSTAISGHVMRGSRHFVEFEVKKERDELQPYINLGVIRTVSLTDGIDIKADWRGEVNPVIVPSRYTPAVAEKLRSQRTAKWGESSVHCCSYYCDSGRCLWTDWDNETGSVDWNGQERLSGSGTVGLLLDLDEGTLSVFKNGRRLGTMKDGLGGEYCWFVAVASPCTTSISRGRAPNRSVIAKTTGPA